VPANTPYLSDVIKRVNTAISAFLLPFFFLRMSAISFGVAYSALDFKIAAKFLFNDQSHPAQFFTSNR
jgi:hypothetical protein